ncbi:MAG: autotransporter-associated beta strand repeat-containing protein [Pirellulales bacterium]
MLDIGVSGYASSNSGIVYENGGIERWSVDNARSGTINLNGGTLQINANQTTTSATINLTSGGIEGYVTQSDQATNNNGVTGVYRTVGSGVTFVLSGNATIGQNLVDGVNGLDSGRGPQQTGFSGALNIYSGTTAQYNGVILELKGAISGVGSLTKQGYDIVTLSGANTYSGGTTVFQGVLRTGATNALGGVGGLTGDVVTKGEGVLDLYGFSQTIRHLSSPASTLANSMGFVTNTGTETVTLTVGNASTANFTYGGTIQNNIALVKTGSDVFKVTAANTFVGGTTVSGGWLETQNTTESGLGTGNVAVSGGRLAGGNATGTTGMIAGVVITSGTGVIEPGAVNTTGSPVSLGGTLNVARLQLNGGSINFQLAQPASTVDDLLVVSGTDLLAASALNISANTTIYISELGLNTFNSGIYPLITYANGTRSGFANLTLGTLSINNGNGSFILTLFDDTANNRIALQSQSNTTLKWRQPTGADAIWDTGSGTHTPKNWVDLVGTPSDWVDNFDAVFDDTAVGYTPNVAGTVTPLSIQFNNTTTYTLGGSGVIAGTGGFTKIGTGKVIINNGNSTFSGGCEHQHRYD